MIKSKHIETINDLFITLRKKYLQQLDDGSYITHNKTCLTDKLVKAHLEHKATYGIYVNKNSKFMMFDIDSGNLENARHIKRILINQLVEMGFDRKYIFTEFSGKKGYHVYIFFEQMKNIVEINNLQKIVIMKLTSNQFYDAKLGNIEIRPTPTQGVKLPLGVHQATKNICWFCDENDNQIESFDYIFTIRKLPEKKLSEIFKKIKIANNTDFAVCRVIKGQSGTGRSISKQTYLSGKEAYETGILFPNTRHNTLFKAALYLKADGMNEEKCHSLLSEWMKNQNPLVITTPQSQWQSDVDRVVKDIYSDKYKGHSKTKTELRVTKRLIHYIYEQTETKCQRTVLFLMVLNQMRFSNCLEDGGFRFSLPQIMEHANVCKQTAGRAVNYLSKNNLIIRKSRKKSANPVIKAASLFGNPPTWYRLNNDLLNLIYEAKHSCEFTTIIDFGKPLYEQMNYAFFRYTGPDEYMQFFNKDAFKTAINDYKSYCLKYNLKT